jgi:AraC family transcriptional regulator of arabinose operon
VARRVTFPQAILSGRTTGAPGDGSDVFRPDGMDGWILHLHLAGRCRVGPGDGRWSAEPGDALLFAPGVPHDYGPDAAAGHWDHRWVWFHPRATWLPWLDWPEAAGRVRRVHLDEADRARVAQWLSDIGQLLTLSWARRTDAAHAVLEQALLWCDRSNPRSAEAQRDPRVRAAQELMTAALDQRWSVPALAARVGLSPSRLAHRFRTEVGEAPLTWLARQRVRRAGDLLLATGRRIADIATEVGFDDPLHFSRVFRRRAGRSPRAFRCSGGTALPDWWRAD